MSILLGQLHDSENLVTFLAKGSSKSRIHWTDSYGSLWVISRGQKILTIEEEL